ncbi:MAG TPA: sulfotransferase family 2 domain-containing protein [Aestuariivirgaceae bacterium]|nr:sulfotransferase family 2 domain-containing protein [Aestuariivirgaceae bacterium]
MGHGLRPQSRRVLCLSFVRNPFARILSCYLNKISSDTERRGDIETRNRFCCAYGFPYDANISFTSFLEAIAKSDDVTENVHWRTQTRNLLNGSLAIDCIGNVEHMEDDLRHILLRVGGEFQTSLGRTHATGADSKLDEYYGARERELVIRKYAEDFERFGYGHDLSDVMPKQRRLSLPYTNKAGFQFARAVGLEHSKPRVALRLCQRAVERHQTLQPYELILRINRNIDPALANEIAFKLLPREDLPVAVDAEMALTLLANRHAEEARTCASRAIAKHPSAPRHHTVMATILQRLKLYPAAIEAVDKALRLSPSNVNLLLLKAKLFEAAGDMDECRKQIDEVLGCAPGNKQALDFHRRMSAGEVQAAG